VRRAPIPDEAALVVRGDELDPDVLTADAERFHRRFKTWSRYGVSAFLATDDAEVDALCETRLKTMGDCRRVHALGARSQGY
jgi:hypothetical protein